MATLLLPPSLNTVEITVVIHEHSDTNSYLPCTRSCCLYTCEKLRRQPPSQGPTQASRPSVSPPCEPRFTLQGQEKKQKGASTDMGNVSIFVLVTDLHKFGKNQLGPGGGNLCLADRYGGVQIQYLNPGKPFA